MLKTRLAFLSVILIIGFVSPLVYGQGYTITKKGFQWGFPRLVGPTIKTLEHFLPEKEIVRLAECAKYPKKLGEEVGKLKLSESACTDTFLRVALHNGVLPAAKEKTIRQMSQVDGLASLLSKINSSNVSQAKGHLKELEIGIACRERGGTVLAFGKKFNDGIKKADTDLDVLVKMNGKKFAIESKAYESTIGTDTVRADLESLKYFCSNIEKGARPIFCFDKVPPKLVQDVLKSKNVEFLTGTGEEICTKLEALAL